MRAESGGNSRAASAKGAIGCMQIMPATWSNLAMRYDLGSDSFDARANMMGGALYLAELRARFGLPGAYAAYNTGPSRYLRVAAYGIPLPAETVAYAARLGRAGSLIIKADRLARWQEAALFMARSNSTAKPVRALPSTAADANEFGAGSDPKGSDPAPATAREAMFPLSVRVVALRH